MKTKIWLITLLLSLSMAGCAQFYSAAEKPPLEFDGDYLNKQIQLLPVEQWNTYKTTDDAAVKLLYATTNKITFPRNYNLRLFILENKEWTEVQDQPVDYPPGEIVLAPNIPIESNDVVTFQPVLPDIKKQYTVRVYIFGDMTTDDGIKKVGAYTDIYLAP